MNHTPPPTPTLDAARQRLLLSFLQLDKLLLAAGWHATGQFFASELLRLAQACVTAWVLVVGRRGGKSSFLCRLGVAQACYGEWTVPPGDVGVVAVVSVSLAEAKQRLKTVKDILDAIGEPHTATSERIRLKNRPCEFRALACSLQGVVGFTAIAILADEVAHWRDDTGSNPAREVMAKLAPTMATVPSAFMVLSSSPASIQTYHHERTLQGNDEQQIVSHAPSWVANPTLTEEQTRELEPNQRIWEREYAAIASEHSAEPVFRKDDILRALAEDTDRGRPVGARICVLDPSTGTGGDAFCFAAVGWNERADGTKVLSIDQFDGQRGRFATTTSPQLIVRKRVNSLCVVHRISHVYSDQHLAPLLEEECRVLGYRFKALPWTHENKADAVNKLALMLSQGQIVLPSGNGWLRKELMHFTEKTSRSGKRTFSAKGKRHDDAVSCLLLAVRLDSVGLLEGSITERVRRNDPPPRAGSPLQSWNQVGYKPQPIAGVRIGSDGHAYVGGAGRDYAIRGRGGF